jgi:citrate lyase beta subunit
MKTTLDDLDDLLAPLARAHAELARAYPGDPSTRQPVHTVYSGAQLVRRDAASRLGAAALRHLDEYFPDLLVFAAALGLPGAERARSSFEERAAVLAAAARGSDLGELQLAATVWQRVRAKLEREPVEDLRIDFEDGYGHRPDDEEDRQALVAAAEVAAGLAAGTLPPFIGIRIKPLTEELHRRSIRTLDLFLTALVEATDGRLPPGFVVTLPKVTSREEVETLAVVFERLEASLGLGRGTLQLELMVETTQCLLDSDGRSALPGLVAAARGRCIGAHFGVYDYTAACGLIASQQRLDHRVCDFARQLAQVALAGTGVFLSDGATNLMPVGPHRAAAGATLSEAELAENQRVVEEVSRRNYRDVRHSLESGYYQGWDLHPSQLPIRYAAVYTFFLEQLPEMTARLRGFVDKSAQATLLGAVFDDAATGQALLNFFLRGLACGALEESEVLATGLTLEEIQTRSFKTILERRRARLGGDAGAA